MCFVPEAAQVIKRQMQVRPGLFTISSESEGYAREKSAPQDDPQRSGFALPFLG